MSAPGMMDLLAIEARLGRRLTRDEVARLRDRADRALARRRLDQSLDSALAALRQADPAAVSPTWGIA